MRITKYAVIAGLSLAQFPAATNAQITTPQIPDIAQAMLAAAYETGNIDEINAVTNAVKSVFPDYISEIDAQTTTQVETLTAAQADAPEAADDAPDDGNTDGGPKTSSIFSLSPWEGKVQAGASFASGNSDNAAVGIAIDAVRITGPITHNVTAFFDIAEQTGDLSQKRWGAAYQLDYAISDRIYAYGRASFEEDQFSGYSYRLFGGAGLGYFLAKSEPFSWKIEGGPGFRYSPLDNSPLIEEEFALYAASETDWLIREGVLFEQDFLVTWTSPTTTLQSITALTTTLTDSISTGISFEYRYETDPPIGTDNEDIIARANLSYGF